MRASDPPHPSPPPHSVFTSLRAVSAPQAGHSDRRTTPTARRSPPRLRCVWPCLAAETTIRLPPHPSGASSVGTSASPRGASLSWPRRPRSCPITLGPQHGPLPTPPQTLRPQAHAGTPCCQRRARRVISRLARSGAAPRRLPWPPGPLRRLPPDARPGSNRSTSAASSSPSCGARVCEDATRRLSGGSHPRKRAPDPTDSTPRRCPARTEKKS